MKKFQKMCAVLAALALGLICFAGCSNDSGGSSGSGNSNNEEETPKVTVVAKYLEENARANYYIFYSDSSYKFIVIGTTIEEGKYRGNPTNAVSITCIAEQVWNNDAGELLPTNYTYNIRINKDENGVLYFWDNTHHYKNFYLE